MHKEVEKKRNFFLKKNKNKKIVFLDIPLLFEKNLENICDVICCTIAPTYIRERRAIQRKGMKKNIFKKIIKNQTTDSYRKKKSDYLINTNQTKRKTCLQVDNMIYDILNK